MSMTREEAIKVLNNFPIDFRNSRGFEAMEALKIAILALRPVSREQVEKVWRGEWKRTHSSDNFWTEVWVCSCCGLEDDNGDCFDFCPSCGAPMTDEAVEMVMERINEMEGTENGLG